MFLNKAYLDKNTIIEYKYLCLRIKKISADLFIFESQKKKLNT